MKKIVLLLTLLCYFTVSFCVPIALAGPSDFVNSIFNSAYSNVTTQSPSAFVSQGENIYSLGYSNVDFNNSGTNIQLFSITPPSFSIGCSGISARFGAIAMLGSKLLQALQEIISSGEVLVFAFNMVLGVLCKQCQNIMSQIESIANKLNGLNFNSCTAAEAMGNLAGAELGKTLNLSSQAGTSGSSWADSLNTELTNPKSTVNTYLSAITSFTNCVNSLTNVNVATNYVETGQCSAYDKASNMFVVVGSLLRHTLKHAHIGLVSGTYAGSGGNGDMIGILRGSFIGDIIGYMPAGKKEQVIRWVSPKYVDLVDQPGSATAAETTSMFDSLTYGGELTSITINYGSQQFDSSGGYSYVSQPQIETKTNVCFSGFFPIYEYYLTYVQDMYFNPSAENSISIPTKCGGPIANLNVNTSIAGNFIASSNMPVILIAKLAYVYNDPQIMDDAALAMAYGQEIKLFSTILSAINAAVASNKDISHSKHLKYYQKYQQAATSVIQQLQKSYERAVSKLNLDNNNIKYLQMLNQQWISALSNNGLAGAYNASSY